MKIVITVTNEELEQMGLSTDSLEEMICDSGVAEDLIHFNVEIQVK